MKILLVNPPTRESETLNLGLAMIASVLRNDGHVVKVLDVHLLRLSDALIEEELKRQEYDALGIGGLSNSFQSIRKIITFSKRQKPSAIVVAGNMAVTASPELFMRFTDADIAVVDEGERTVIELFRALETKSDLKKIRGIWLREGGNLVSTPPRERIQDLDALPFPAWDLFPMERFFERRLANFGYSINVSTTRGCPFNCHYCSRSFGRQVTYRSAESIVVEMIYLKERYPLLEHVVLGDDLFMTNKARNTHFCNLLIEKKLGLTWSASARVGLVDESILRLMKRAGCICIGFGFESGSQPMLDAMNKGVKVPQAEEAIRIVRCSGFQPVGSFIIGYPGETRETLTETLMFIRRMRLPPVKFFFATPYPGTKLYEIARERNLILNELTFLESLAENSEDLIVNFTEFSDDELKALKKWAEWQTFRSATLSLKLRCLLDWFLIRWERARSRGLFATVRLLADKVCARLYPRRSEL